MSEQQEVQSVHAEYRDEWTKIDSTSSWAKAKLLYRWRLETRADDPTIAKEIDSTKQTVNMMRSVWEEFGDRYERGEKMLPFVFYKTAIAWDDADKWLREAKRKHWTCSEMSTQRALDKSPKPPEVDELDDFDSFPQADDEPGCTEADDLPDEPRSTTIYTPSEPVSVKSAERRTDRVGKDVPPRLRESFETGARLDNPKGLVRAVIRELTDILGQTPTYANPMLHNRFGVIEKYLMNVMQELEHSTPYAVCSKCGGHEDNCPACRGTGWLNQENFKKVR